MNEKVRLKYAIDINFSLTSKSMIEIQVFGFHVGEENLRMTSRKVFTFGAAGLVGCCTVYYLFQKKLSSIIINSECGKDTVKLLNSHSGAKLFLGEPIEPVLAKFTDYKYDQKSSNIRMIVSGPKAKGEVFFTVEIDNDKLKLNSVHLQIGNDDTKRLEIKPADQ